MGPPSSAAPEAPPATGARRRWRWALALLVLAGTLLIADLARPPQDQLSARALLGVLDLYQATLSPLMPSLGVTCRFEPSCSCYAEGAIRARGALEGSGLTARRLVRCGPWTPAGTVDPPPEPAER